MQVSLSQSHESLKAETLPGCSQRDKMVEEGSEGYNARIQPTGAGSEDPAKGPTAEDCGGSLETREGKKTDFTHSLPKRAQHGRHPDFSLMKPTSDL